MHRLALAFLLSLFATPALACGPDTDCVLGDRIYRIAMPEGHDGTTKVGAIVFSHGYRGSASGLMRNRNLRRMVSDMGLALIALKSADDDWVLPNSPRHMDSDGEIEFTYVDAVLDHAEANFAIDRDRLMATGFSAGGMMTWNLACARPNQFAAFAPISGTFWLEPPTTCKKPAKSIIHIHGDADRTVPLSGRPIQNTRQGDVGEAIEMYARFGGFSEAEPMETSMFDCSRRSNAADDFIDFCMFEGGHSFRSEYLRYAWDMFEAEGKL